MAKAKKNEYRKTVNERLKKDKELMLKALREMPIIAVACEKASVGRTTFYSWRKNNKEFLRLSDEAMKNGEEFLNDMAKSQLVSLMKDKYWPPIKYYLEHRHPEYIEKDYTKVKTESLTKEQQTLVRQALKFVVRPKNNEKITVRQIH